MDGTVRRRPGPAQPHRPRRPRAPRWAIGGTLVAVLLLSVVLLPSAIARQQPTGQQAQEHGQHGLDQFDNLRAGDQCGGYQQCSESVLGTGMLVKGDGICSDEHTSTLWSDARNGRLPVQHVLAMVLVHSRTLCPPTPGQELSSLMVEDRSAGQPPTTTPPTTTPPTTTPPTTTPPTTTPPTTTPPTTTPPTTTPPTTTPPSPDPFGLKIDLEVDASNERAVQTAIAMLRSYGQLADQRTAEIDQLDLYRFDRLRISDECGEYRPCVNGVLGTAELIEGDSLCSVDLYIPNIQDDAREWQLSVTQLVATTLVHEQEHCLYEPDEREFAPIEAEIRFAHQVGDPGMIAYAESLTDDIDSEGFWLPHNETDA
jgi:hypothetical protein